MCESGRLFRGKEARCKIDGDGKCCDDVRHDRASRNERSLPTQQLKKHESQGCCVDSFAGAHGSSRHSWISHP